MALEDMGRTFCIISIQVRIWPLLSPDVTKKRKQFSSSFNFRKHRKTFLNNGQISLLVTAKFSYPSKSSGSIKIWHTIMKSQAFGRERRTRGLEKESRRRKSNIPQSSFRSPNNGTEFFNLLLESGHFRLTASKSNLRTKMQFHHH